MRRLTLNAAPAAPRPETTAARFAVWRLILVAGRDLGWVLCEG
jgi:hypothetical protein